MNHPEHDLFQEIPTSNDDQAPILPYGGYQSENHRSSDPLFVLLLCSPGSYCWFTYLCSAAHLNLPETFFFVALFAWPIAIITAILSLILYFRWPPSAWPWFTRFNLFINITGLLFTLLNPLRLFNT